MFHLVGEKADFKTNSDDFSPKTFWFPSPDELLVKYRGDNQKHPSRLELHFCFQFENLRLVQAKLVIQPIVSIK
jgi:hypothetical protein